MGSSYLEMLAPKDKYPVKAKYYENTVDGTEDGGQVFGFDYVDPLSKTYRTLFGNITSDRDNGETTIRTNKNLPFSQGSYIVLPDGVWYQIVQCQTDFSTASKEALRMFAMPVGVERIIRMVQIPNPWGIS